MDQAIGDQRRESGQLFEAVITPAPALALVRDDESGDLTVLSLVDTSCKPLVLSGTAAVIWDELDGVRSLKLIVRELSADYGLDEQVIGEQVLGFVTQLLDAHLLQILDSHTSA
ncbi:MULTISPECIES: PqqD family protein [unclassified Pseudoclavibacter]|uniref:PqqD family protein n=1 Tax=unclassified Pseudoclavibacter TaxID=2615177 RepID=UPI000CE79848|nr:MULTISPECIES: PqqD family protein [unclassified Pseudoclavibacter]PPF34271.1 hypothetical protein C5E05_15325 [Pseudoclavibacter sp. AY1H1]PPG05228.1 hypothetical protein C5E06_02470 [Pseudoclavibacter sp. RFBI5]